MIRWLTEKLFGTRNTFGIPDRCEKLVVIHNTQEGDMRVLYFGMGAEQAVTTLYSVADEIMRQKVPLPSRLSH